MLINITCSYFLYICLRSPASGRGQDKTFIGTMYDTGSDNTRGGRACSKMSCAIARTEPFSWSHMRSRSTPGMAPATILRSVIIESESRPSSRNGVSSKPSWSV